MPSSVSKRLPSSQACSQASTSSSCQPSSLTSTGVSSLPPSQLLTQHPPGAKSQMAAALKGLGLQPPRSLNCESPKNQSETQPQSTDPHLSDPSSIQSSPRLRKKRKSDEDLPVPPQPPPNLPPSATPLKSTSNKSLRSKARPPQQTLHPSKLELSKCLKQWRHLNQTLLTKGLYALYLVPKIQTLPTWAQTALMVGIESVEDSNSAYGSHLISASSLILQIEKENLQASYNDLVSENKLLNKSSQELNRKLFTIERDLKMTQEELKSVKLTHMGLKLDHSEVLNKRQTAQIEELKKRLDDLGDVEEQNRGLRDQLDEVSHEIKRAWKLENEIEKYKKKLDQSADLKRQHKVN
ncbi:hypothetical protein PPACK8108_LOCUS14563 [Phakopsora pachyrhizi]|uniref:Uncharacterized protein n=1 Tax=Phakopsora pachyrhizi TaxID=170000 RepID=A0AAV0B812_PHAPC|nr:hypothetical protein PPACK8108_LOCUS14563 [Phakopsora pachyrhizi]